MIRVGTHHNLTQVKQEVNETLRSYTWRLFKTRATIANITDEDIIRCFQNGLFSKHTYNNFGHKENDRFTKRNSDKKGNGNGHFDKSQQNNSGNPRKRKLDQEVAAVEHNPCGKKLGNNDTQFETVLHKQCLVHPKS
jgi:hypothetical protein